MSEENPLVGFLTKRGFNLLGESYFKNGMDQRYTVKITRDHYELTCVWFHPDGSFESLGRGWPKGRSFNEDEIEKELVKRGMKFLTQTELDQICPFCHLPSAPIQMSDGGSNYCSTCGPWHRCQDGPVKGSPGPMFCRKCHPLLDSSSDHVWGDSSSDFDEF